MACAGTDQSRWVADLEAGVFDGAREAVPCAGAAEREEVTARL